MPKRAQPIAFPQARFGADGLVYCVYGGNFPNIVRQALALRKTPSGKPIWIETPAVTENIMNMDMVWKAVNYQRSKGFE